MAYIFLVGLVVAALAVAGYFIINKRNNNNKELAWRTCISIGLQVYLISLFLGSLVTAIFQNLSSNEQLDKYLINLIEHTFALLFYAILFSFFIVLPTLILGLKFLSKTRLENIQKQISFVGLSFILVLILNATMTGFFSNADFMIFLAGFSFFGITIPWIYIRKVFIAKNNN